MNKLSSKNKWFMHLCIAGETVWVLFDGTKVYDSTNGLVINELHAACGMFIPQEILVEICTDKMLKLDVVRNARNGEWMTEEKGTPWSCSIASEAYWCN